MERIYLAEVRTKRHYRANAKKHRAAQYVNNFETCFVTAESPTAALVQARMDRGPGAEVQIIGDLETIDAAIVASQQRRAALARELSKTDARIAVWQRRRQRMLAELKEIG